MLPLPGLLLLWTPARAEEAPPSWESAYQLLCAQGRLTPEESRLLTAGGSVAKVVDTDDRSEILTFAATSVRTTPSRVHELLRDLEGCRGEPWTREIGVFERGETGLALTVDPNDVRFLSECRLNDCELRLSAEAIEELRNGISAAPLSRRGTRANLLFGETLARYVEAYRTRGDAALFLYVNNRDPVRVADSLARVFARSPFLYALAPDLFTYLEKYPEGRPADAWDVVYWVKEKFWLRDVTSVWHLVVTDRAVGPGRLVLAVSKQLYASRYYESSLGTTALLEGPAGSYLFLITRTRADIRPTGFTRVERALLNYLVRRRLQARLVSLRAQLERP